MVWITVWITVLRTRSFLTCDHFPMVAQDSQNYHIKKSVLDCYILRFFFSNFRQNTANNTADPKIIFQNTS